MRDLNVGPNSLFILFLIVYPKQFKTNVNLFQLKINYFLFNSILGSLEMFFLYNTKSTR
jgi:hypothetical protein